MGSISFLAAVVLTLTVVEGVYILYHDPRGMPNRLFACMAACIALWLLGVGLGYGSATEESARLWFRISSPGFIFLHCCTLHFVLSYTGRLAKPAWQIVALLSYVPSMIFQYIAWTGTLVFRSFSLTGRLWIGEPDFGSLSFSLLMAQYLSYYAVSIGLLLHDAFHAKRQRDRRQFVLIASGIGVSVFLFNIEPFLLPLISPYRTILVSPLFSIVLISAAAFAIRHYRFLSTSSITFGHSTLDRLSDAIILLDTNLRKVYANAMACSLFPDALMLDGLIMEAAEIRTALNRTEDRGLDTFSCVLSSKAPGNARVDCCFSLMRDPAGELESILLVGIPIKDAPALNAGFGLTQAESRVISMLVEGRCQDDIAHELGVSIRTIKAHCAHIYQKLGVTNKIEMFRLLGEYKLISSKAADQSVLPLLLKKPKAGCE